MLRFRAEPKRWDGSYPASIVTDGMAMNITLSTYDQNVDCGIIACRRSMPQVQRIIDYMEDALAELEEAAGLAASPKKAKAAPRRKSGTRKSGARKAKPKPKAATGPRAKKTAKAKAGQVNARKGKSVTKRGG